MVGFVSNKVRIVDADRQVRDWCENNLVLDNPEWHKKHRMGLWCGNVPKEFKLYETVGTDILVPFGSVSSIAKDLNLPLKSLIGPIRSVNYKSHINTYTYQEEAVREALRARNGVIVMPCGAGKTQTGLEVVARIGGRALWLTHTQDLLNQSMNRAKSVFDCDNRSYGTITGGKVNIGEGLTFATVQTMSKLDLTEYRDCWDVVIVDECFPGNTLVTTIDGQKKIKNLLHGDLVASYNRDNGRIEFKPVVSTLKIIAHDLLKVTLCDGTAVDATSNHPFFVKGKGWVHAEEMEVGDYVMQLVRQGVRRNEKAEYNKSENKKTRLRLLLSGLRIQSGTSETGVDGGTPGKVCGTYEESERRISRTDHGADDKKKSNERPGSKIKSVGAAERDWAQTEGARRKWHGNDCAAKDARKRNTEKIDRPNCCRGISNSDKDGKRFRLSDLLQGRYCTRGADDCDRDRWVFSLFCRKAKSGQEENGVFNWVRVDSIEIQEQTSDGTFGGLCADGCVYNIEVADNNNYFANGILVHNCHRAIGSPTKVMQFYKVLSNLSCRYKFGLTATPKRADGLERSMFALLGDVIHEVSRDEVSSTTCPVNVELIRTGYMPDMDLALSGDGTINYAGLVKDLTGNSERLYNVAAKINQVAEQGATLVLANRVEYLQRLEGILTKAGRTCICLSGLDNSKAAKQERKEALRKLNAGEIDCVLASYKLAAEGLDCPNLRYVVLATPEKDPSLVQQATGRVGRKANNKECGIVVDFIDDFGMYKGWAKKRESVYKKLGYAIYAKEEEK